MGTGSDTGLGGKMEVLKRLSSGWNRVVVKKAHENLIGVPVVVRFASWNPAWTCAYD